MAVLTGFLSGVHERLVLTVLSTGFLSCFKIHRSLARLSSFTQERVNAERPAHPRARCASQTGLWLGFAPRVVQHVNTPAPPECRLGPCLPRRALRPGEGTLGVEGACAGLHGGLPASLVPAHVACWAPRFLDLNLHPPSASALLSLMVAEGFSAG